MKIFAVYGKSNIGKTTVIKDLCERLKSKYNCKNYDLHVQDVCCVFDINGKKVGITSYGDNAEVLKAPFSFFEKENCDIIITASRIRYTKTGSTLFIRNFAQANKAELKWIKKDYLDTKKESDKNRYKDEINSINAKFVDLVLSSIL